MKWQTPEKSPFSLLSKGTKYAAQFSIALLFAFNLTGCDENKTEKTVKHISLLSLFQEPKKFEGQQIAVKGYLKLDTLARLYFHREDAIYRLTENAVLVNLPANAAEQVRASCDAKHIRVIGEFDNTIGIVNVESISVVEMNQLHARNCWHRE